MDRLLICVAVVTACEGVRDFTVQKGGRGCQVASAVIRRLENSGLFKPDNFMLSRISLTLDFGRNGFSNFSHQGRGLFGVTMLMWTNAGNAAIFLGLSEQIQKKFCFDIVTSSYEDMDVPIKAGIVVMLLLMRRDTIPHRFQIEEQAAMAADVYGLTNEPSFLKTYIERSQALVNKSTKGICLLNCAPQQVDLAFALDASANLLTQDWYKITSFIKNYAELSAGIFLQGDGTGYIHLALMFFNSEVTTFDFKTVLQIANSQNNPTFQKNLAAAVEIIINSYAQNRTDFNRSVGAAIDTARILFRNPERGCRIADSSIAKNLVILLSGEPDNSTKMQKARENFANEVPEANVFSVGVQQDALHSTLKSISGSFLKTSSYASLDDFSQDYEQVFVKLCNGFAIVPLPNDNQSQSQPSSSANPENLNYYHLHNMTLLKPAITQWSYFQIAYHPGSLIRMKVQFEFERVENASIEINIFFTFGDVLPSAISHDFMLRVHEKATKKILIRPNSDVLFDVCSINGGDRPFEQSGLYPSHLLTVGIIPSIQFKNKETADTWDYRTYVEEASKNFPSLSEYLWSVFEKNEMVMKEWGLGVKGIGDSLNEYGEDTKYHEVCPLSSCQVTNFVKLVNIETVTKDATLAEFDDYENLFNGLLIPDNTALLKTRARFREVSLAGEEKNKNIFVLFSAMHIYYIKC